MAIILKGKELNGFMFKKKRIRRIAIGHKVVMDSENNSIPYDVEGYEYWYDNYNSIILSKYIGSSENIDTSLKV